MTAKRGRSEDDCYTPTLRQRTSSPVLDQGTPSWRENILKISTQVLTETPTKSVHDNIEQGEVGENSSWINTMNEDRLSQSLSEIPEHLGKMGDNEIRTKGTESVDSDTATDGTELIGDQSINRMIQATLHQRSNVSISSITGVNKLPTNQPPHQHLPHLLKMMEEVFQKALNEAIDPLKAEIKRLTTIIETNNPTITTNLMQQPLTNPYNPPIWPRIISPPFIPHIPKVNDRDQAFNLARRSIGLYPINLDDLIRNTSTIDDNLDKATREQQGGANTVRDYLCLVLKMKEAEASKLNIIRTFRQPGKGNTNVLFVEFTTEADIKKIRSLASNMETSSDDNPRLQDFIPKLLQKEYDVVALKAFEGRTMSPKNSTKIWITNKFELRLRPKGDYTPWNKIPQTELIQEQMDTGTTPKINPKPSETQQTRTKPDFSSNNNPNFQIVGKEPEDKSSWTGPNLLPDQTKMNKSSSSMNNRFLVLGAELNICP